MLSYLEALKLYAFFSLITLSSFLLYGILAVLFALFILIPLAKLTNSPFVLTYCVLIPYIIFFMVTGLVLAKKIFFSCLKHKFKNFQLETEDLETTWGQYFKIIIPIQLVAILASSIVEGLIAIVQKGSFAAAFGQPTNIAIAFSIATDFLAGAWITRFWIHRNDIRKKEPWKDLLS